MPAVGGRHIDLAAAPTAGGDLFHGRRCDRRIEPECGDRGQHAEAVEHPMAADRPQVIARLLVDHMGADVTAIDAGFAFQQTHIGVHVATKLMIRAIPAFGDAGAVVEHRVVAVENGGAAGHDPVKNLAFGVGDGGDVGEMANVHRFDIGDQGDLGPRQARQGADFAGVVHAHFKHAKIARRRRAGQRQGRADMIVEIALVDMQ